MPTTKGSTHLLQAVVAISDNPDGNASLIEQALCYSGCVPRPRIHSVEDLLDATERIAVQDGPAAVTVRAVSQATGISNGAIYHAFGSRGGMVGHAWLRAAQRFLDMQRDAVDGPWPGAKRAPRQ